MRLVLAAALCLTAPPAFSEGHGPSVSVNDCDWASSARNIPEPWENHSRSFSNGKTRVTMLDTIEPAAGAFRLLVLSPPHGELGDRQCREIGFGTMGFAGMLFDQLETTYDPATGLDFHIPVQFFDGTDFSSAMLWFRLNQATGEIWAELQGGPLPFD